MATFLLATLALWLTWTAYFATREAATPREAFAYGAVAFAAQLVATELALGIAGVLTRPALLAALALGAIPPAVAAASRWRLSVLRFSTGARGDAALWLLVALAGVALAWIAAAAWLLPPRGMDDLAY